MKKLIRACSLMLLLFLIKNDQVMAQPDALDVCHDSVDRIETLLTRFPKLAKLGDPLKVVLTCDDGEIDSSRRYQIAELLLKYGANPNIRYEKDDNRTAKVYDDLTPLGLCNDSALAELLIEKGARVDELQGDLNSYRLVPYLFHTSRPEPYLDKAHHPNAHTPLFQAVMNICQKGNEYDDWLGAEEWHNRIIKSRGVIQALLRHGANPNSKNQDDQTPLYRFLSQGFPDEFIEEAMSGRTIGALDDSIIQETALDIVKSLVDAGAKVNGISLDDGPYGYDVPIDAAVRDRWPACVEYLISKGANFNLRDKNGDPILYLVIKDKEEIIDRNREMNTVPDEKENFAIEADDQIISILRSHGAKEK